MKFFEQLGRGVRNSRLDFGGDVDHDPRSMDPGIIYLIAIDRQ